MTVMSNYIITMTSKSVDLSLMDKFTEGIKHGFDDDLTKYP